MECPFCGSGAKLFALCGQYAMQCTNELCKALGPMSKSEAEAMLKYGTRFGSVPDRTRVVEPIGYDTCFGSR